MELENKKNTNNSELFINVKKLKPRFSNSKEAIQYFTKKLENISSLKKCTIEELIFNAEKKPNDELFLDALSLSRKIQFLKKVKASHGQEN